MQYAIRNPQYADFQFSQASLQDFVECPRRFYLRYIAQVAWPAVLAEPVEEHERRMQLGQGFHRLVQQHLLGLPEERLTRMAAVDPDLARWWQHYRTYRPATALPVKVTEAGEDVRYPELTLAASVAGARLVAKYDLLVIRPGARATIFDWKTSHARTRASILRTRLQTRVYRYLLVRAGAYLNGGVSLDPAQVEMIYWFAEFPESPERLPYSAAVYQDDARYLAELITRIQGMTEDAFILTPDEKQCTYCPYRSYCDRGREAGLLDAAEDELAEPDAPIDLDLDFEQIAEIAF